jgi:hypothetical protein
MADPVSEQIMAALASRLGGITGTGYHQNVHAVVRPTRMGGFTPTDKDIILRFNSYTGDVNLSPCGYIDRDMMVKAECVLQPAESSTTSVDEAILWFAGDVEKSIKSDDTLGGLCHWADVTDVNRIDSANADYDGADVTIQIRFRTSRTDPTVKG